jgi:hypothetical protein
MANEKVKIQNQPILMCGHFGMPATGVAAFPVDVRGQHYKRDDLGSWRLF